MVNKRHPSSYRDPSGYVFEVNGTLYRRINRSYADDYLHLKNSGLLNRLIKQNLLVAHQESTDPISDYTGENENRHTTDGDNSNEWMIIKPEKIEQLSYPSEWSFDGLKDAALLHLEIMQLSLEHDMILKDASPYNVQFRHGKAVFIDTLSFKRYDEKLPWIAYRQFCECFLYPLLIEHYRIMYVHQLYAVFPEGVPVAYTAGILPFRSRFSLGCWLNVYLPASVAKTKQTNQRKIVFSKQKLKNLLTHLHGQVRALNSNDKSTAAWNTYYAETILSEEYLSNKKIIVAELIAKIKVRRALDLGSNDGYFSKLLHNKGISVIAVDNDAPSVNRLFLRSKKETLDILPLVIDITAPTPATGFENLERDSFLKRLDCDLIIALALIHHLVIGKNIPLEMLAAFFNAHSPWLIIEFIPKDDPKVIAMLADREDVFTDYNQEHFERTLSTYFILQEKHPVRFTKRTMYLYKRKG